MIQVRMASTLSVSNDVLTSISIGFQSNVFNYFHPMGFAYFPDGAHDDKIELEPSIAPPGTNSPCAETLTCDAPMYFRNGTYLGTYSNIPEVLDITQGEEDFGLDDYERRFFWPFAEWLEQGNEEERFSIALRFTNLDFAQDIFYFCHVSNNLSNLAYVESWLRSQTLLSL
jgi:hypothetical protein